MKTTADSCVDESVSIDTNTKAMKIIRRMLQENADIKFIASVTGLSFDEILKLQNRM